jgi:hypothetical protein
MEPRIRIDRGPAAIGLMIVTALATPAGVGDQPPDPKAFLARKADNQHTGKDLEAKA